MDQNNLKEEIKDIFTIGIWHDTPSGYERVVDRLNELILSKFKAYQSHLISEGEKMKRQTDEDTNGYCITCGGYIFGNECTCDIYTKAITSYQAIIRDEK